MNPPTTSKMPNAMKAAAPIATKRASKKKDVGKKNNGTTTGFGAVAKNASKEYGSKAAGQKVAGAVYQKMKASGKL